MEGTRVLNLSNKKLTSLHEIEGVNLIDALDVLDLSRNKIRSLEGLNAFYHLPLQILNLSSNKLSTIEHLNTLNNLRSLDLSHNYIANIEDLNVLHNLETLNLSHNQIEHLNALKPLKNLRILNIRNNALSDILSLNCLTSLHTLLSQGNPFYTTLSYILGPRSAPRARKAYMPITEENLSLFLRQSQDQIDEVLQVLSRRDAVELRPIYYIPLDLTSLYKVLSPEELSSLIYCTVCHIERADSFELKRKKTIVKYHYWRSQVLITDKFLFYFDETGRPIKSHYRAGTLKRTNSKTEFEFNGLYFRLEQYLHYEDGETFRKRSMAFRDYLEWYCWQNEQEHLAIEQQERSRINALREIKKIKEKRKKLEMKIMKIKSKPEINERDGRKVDKLTEELYRLKKAQEELEINLS